MTSSRRHPRSPLQAAPGPIATLIAPVAGVLALPLALIPLVITMISVRRYAEVWRTLRQTIQTLSRLTEAGGYTPPDHAHRTAQLGRAMAQRMGLGEREVTALEYAALLHDLGQVVLADPIPGGATVLAAPADQRMIASTGATIIRHGPDFAAVADLVEAQAVQYRSILEHEARAPLASRILRVANAFDDLTGGSRSQPRFRGHWSGSTWAWAMTTTPRSWPSSRRPSHTARSHSRTVAPGAGRVETIDRLSRPGCR